jgi:hypothetical protein
VNVAVLVGKLNYADFVIRVVATHSNPTRRENQSLRITADSLTTSNINDIINCFAWAITLRDTFPIRDGVAPLPTQDDSIGRKALLPYL